MLNTKDEKINKELNELRVKVNELLTKTYEARLTHGESYNKEKHFVIDDLVKIRIETYYGDSYSYGCKGIELIIEEKEYSYSEDSVRRRHIKKYEESKLIKTIDVMLVAAKLAKERREAKTNSAKAAADEKESNKLFQQEELCAPFFTNTYEGQLKGDNFSYDSRIIRNTNGTYNFKGQINLITLEQLNRILTTINENNS